MILKKIILSNIKSYVYEEIDFSNGINCILGLNGSGKSTIIESIGLALFDFKGKNMNKMLRYNESKGTIEIDFFGADDRLYRVVRTIRAKGSGNVKLIDVEHDSELFHTTSDVYAFIQKVLNIPKTKEFSKLFEEIIAVPQGQYVSAFLETPTKRKENFDRLFELDKYKETGQKLKELSDGIKNTKVRVLTEELIALNTKLESLPSLQQKQEQLTQELKKREAKQEEDKKALTAVGKKKQQQEQYKLEIDDLKTAVELNKEKTKHHEANQQKTTEELALSRKAMDVVTKTLADYLRYERNAEEMNQKEKEHTLLEQRRALFHETQNKIASATTEKANIEANIAEKSNARMIKTDEIQKINQDIFLEKTKLEEAVLAHKSVEEQTKNRRAQYEESNNHLQQDLWHLKSVVSKLDALQLESVQHVYFLKNRIEENNKELLRVQVANKQLADFEIKKNTLDTQYNTNLENSMQTVDGMCPFLNEKCKNINENSLSRFFEEEMKRIDTERKKLLETMNLVRLEKKESDILLEIQNDQIVLNREQEKSEKQSLLLQELIRVFGEKGSLEAKEYVKFVEEDLDKRLEELNQEKQRLELMQKEHTKAESEFLSKGLQLRNAEERSKLLESESKELEKQLDTLQKNRNRKIIELDRLDKELAVYKNALSESDQIKKRLNELRNENSELETQRKLYLSNIEKSKEAERYQRQLSETADIIKLLSRENKEMEESIAELVGMFSKKLLEEYTSTSEKLAQDISANKALIESCTIQLQELAQQITVLIDMEKERDLKQIDLDKYNEIVTFLAATRSIFTGLPLKLSKRYRENISNMATDLYQKISMESVRIQIEEDYEVKLIDLIHDDKVKAMEQLSGGEQMSVAIAIRLAMLKHLSRLDIYFLDEPTINLDIQRRDQIRDVVSEVSNSIRQLFVISHDDTFDSITERVIHVEKTNNSSKII